MGLINSRKLSWIICGLGCLSAIIAMFFLPDIIPTHFTGGVADGFSSKLDIFLCPLLQTVIVFLSGRKKIKYCLTHSRTFFTDIQYNWMVSGLALLILWIEIWLILVSLN
ncbi:DUF1648 domain-containing protein [Muricomes intestini]|jgi:hypothetical protein|uniref:Uncharacterized protein DUF1648 n=1 Tax=Muricomes intestini TaxID=1796634 RepID=A0A4R3JZU5_9FIRM|nr:DUF1648 domain-containing protein [Muricomes intestini]TCS74849.1 uncharacterized protein DUF1648 [Muricomes intestini]